MRATSIAACRFTSDEVLLQIANQFRQQLDGPHEFSITVTGVQRIDRDRAWIIGDYSVGDLSDTLGPPSLAVYEDGQWRDGGCLILDDSQLPLQRPTEIDEDQRVSYIGETVKLQFDWEEDGYEFMVVDYPTLIDDTLFVPVRITAITETLDLSLVTLGGSLETEPDEEGNYVELWTEPCEEGFYDDAVLVQGQSYETFLCFRPIDASEQHTGSPQQFRYFVAFDGDALRVVDLTRVDE